MQVSRLGVFAHALALHLFVPAGRACNAAVRRRLTLAPTPALASIQFVEGDCAVEVWSVIHRIPELGGRDGR